MFCAEGLAFQSLVLFAGIISVEEQAAQSICALLSTSLFLSSFGYHDASSTLIGNAIGHTDIRLGTSQAWRVASIISMVTIVGAVMVLIPLFSFRLEIATFFT